MSAKKRDNISEVKTTACDILLEHRLSKKHLGEKKNDNTDNMEIESKKEERIGVLIDKNGGHGV